MTDFIVVGSGCTGAMAAQTLVEAGKTVTMLDVGFTGQQYEQLIPEKNFLDIRKSEVDQHTYLLGNAFEGVAWGLVGKGEQLTPPRKHIFEQTNTFLPVDSKTFSPAESLGYGGLGIGWGIGCWEFSAAECAAAGLDYAKMQTAYNDISKRIGISATKDDAGDYSLGGLDTFMPSPTMDQNGQYMYKKYQSHKQKLENKGFTMGRAPLALITKDKGKRKKYSYLDMDFYSDKSQSAWRPWITVNELRQKSNFTYIGGQLVTHFSEKAGYVAVHCLNTQTRKTTVFKTKRLVLASGVLGTGRIVLRSSKSPERLPLLCNPYSYVPCIQPALLGQAADNRKLGFAQLSLFLDEDRDGFDVSMASIYSYQSLMLFRLARQAPLSFADSRTLLQYILPGLMIMGIHMPDQPDSGKYMQLVTDPASPTGDKLKIHYQPTAHEVRLRNQREKKYMAAARTMGAFPLKKIDPGFGSSIHYAGVLPFSLDEKPFTLAPNGRLHNTKNVFVADGSGFTYLPAKGLTFSLLAHAHITARNAL